MKDFFKTLAAVILGSALVLLAGFFLLVGSLTTMISMGLAGTAPAIPGNAILHITFEEGVATQDSDLPSLGFLPSELNQTGRHRFPGYRACHRTSRCRSFNPDDIPGSAVSECPNDAY